jgi:hypothetical protein
MPVDWIAHILIRNVIAHSSSKDDDKYCLYEPCEEEGGIFEDVYRFPSYEDLIDLKARDIWLSLFYY